MTTAYNHILGLPPRSLLIFVDETGNDDLSGPNNPTFGRGGCGVLLSEYKNSIAKPWRRLKRKRNFFHIRSSDTGTQFAESTLARSAVPSSHSTPLTSSRRVPLSARVAERRRHEKDHEQISLDGVIQAPGGPNEDGDYPHGGWAVPHSDPAVREAHRRGARLGFRSAAGPPNLRYLERLLAESREQSDGGQSERGDEIRRDPQAGQSWMGAGRGPWTGHRRGRSPRG